MEKKYDITIITQNVDDLHERAGSNEVWHVHGDLTKVTSSKNRFDMSCIQYYPLNEPIMVGQQAADGSQLRPFVVMMDEYLPPLNVASNVSKRQISLLSLVHQCLLAQVVFYAIWHRPKLRNISLILSIIDICFCPISIGLPNQRHQV